jgi:ParB-like chromosome segregation protein Spo0J
MGIKEQSLGRKDVFLYDPKLLIEKDGWNARVEGPELNQYIRDLSDYIKNGNPVPGILDVYVEGEQVILIDGHCRTQAAIMAINEGAELKGVLVRVLDRYINETDRIARLITSNSGRPLSPIEKASVVKRLMNFNVPVKEIAIKTGMSVSTVQGLLDLCGAAPEVQEMVKKGEVSATQAVKTIRKEGASAGPKLKKAVEKAKSEGKSRATAKQIESRVTHPPAGESNIPKINPTLDRIKEVLGKLDKSKFLEVLNYMSMTAQARNWK